MFAGRNMDLPPIIILVLVPLTCALPWNLAFVPGAAYAFARSGRHQALDEPAGGNCVKGNDKAILDRRTSDL